MLAKLEQLTRDIADAIVSGQCSTLDDLQQTFGISFSQAVQLMSDPIVEQTLSDYRKSRSVLILNGPAFNRIERVINSGNDRDALSAIKLLAELSNTIKTGVSVNVNSMNVSLESRIRKSDEKDDLKKARKIIDIKRESGV